MSRDEPVTYAFSKSGGYSPDGPLADFYEQFFATPALRLPARNWTISADGSFFTGADCGDWLPELSASVEMTVEP